MCHRKVKRRSSMLSVVNFSGTELHWRTSEIRIVLLGKTGVGKIATENIILGRNVFRSPIQYTSESSEKSERKIRGAPGSFHGNVSEKKVQNEASFPDLCRTVQMNGRENRWMRFTKNIFDETRKYIKKRKLGGKLKEYKQEQKMVDQTERQKIVWCLERLRPPAGLSSNFPLIH